MSSPVYSTELRTEPLLRRIVLLTGLLFVITGLIVILMMPLAFGWRIAAGGSWVLFGLREVIIIRNAYAAYFRLRLDSAGKLELVITNGANKAATLLAGSVVLAGVAWLRIESADGLRCAELLRGNCRENKQWRRLQVIWRHFGADS